MNDTRVRNKEMREFAGNTQKVHVHVRCGWNAALDSGGSPTIGSVASDLSL